MLTKLIKTSLRHRGAVFAVAVLLLAYGVLALTRAQYDVFPEFAPPMAIVATEAPGFSAGEVERLVTGPVEAALGGTLGLVSMRSKSLQGLSMVNLIFAGKIDVWRARELVNERLSQLAARLPQGADPPHLLPLTSATSVVMQIGLTSTSLSPMALDDAARFTLRPQLLGIPGVADVIIFGGARRQIRISVSPSALIQHDLTLGDVIRAVRAASGTSSAGHVSTPNQRLAVALHSDESQPADFADLSLGWPQGNAVRLKDVARVGYGSPPPLGAAAINGKSGIILVIENQFGTNILQVSQALDRRLAVLGPIMARQGIILHQHLFHPADFIITALHRLGMELLVGAGFVVLVLLLFLGNARTGFISVIAIPLSLLTATIVLNHFGVTLNTMSIGGLAIALGEVVDDAIIDVENINRRLAENRRLALPVSAFTVVLRASLEVRSSVVFATLVVITVFMPVLALTGVAGLLFAPLALAYIVAVVASLLVALTLTPALALAWLDGSQQANLERAWVAWLKRLHIKLLQKMMGHWKSVGAIGVASLLAMAITVPFLHLSYIPALREGHYVVHVGLAPGSSLRQSMRVGANISKVISKVPGVSSVAQTAGRAQDVIDPVGVHLSEFAVNLKSMDAGGQERTLRAIRAALTDFPGLSTSVNTFLAERIDETISGTTAPVVIKVFGPDLDVIDRTAIAIAELVGKMHGVRSVNIEATAELPQISVRLHPRAIAAHGLQPGRVMNAVAAAEADAKLGEVHRENRGIPIVVAMQPEKGDGVTNLRNLSLRDGMGRTLSLSDLASLSETSARYQISHEAGQRVASVAIELGSGNVAAFTSKAQALVTRNIAMPPATYALFTGAGQAATRAAQDLADYGFLALAVVLLLLALALGSMRAVVLVMFNLPFALIGGLVSLLPGGLDVSIGALVGFLTLFGISLRNSIMLVAHCQRLPADGSAQLGESRAIQGASDRLVPILMTASATALALLPLGLTSGASGNEIEGPMAQVILGGLITSTLLNLLVLPVFAARWLKIGEK